MSQGAESRLRWSRRTVLHAGIGAAAVVVGEPLVALAGTASRQPLLPPNDAGLRLKPGFAGRVVARSGAPPLAGNSYRWHRSPDGGATFAQPDGGWIYVSNSEANQFRGGASALRFDRAGTLVDVYPVLAGTNLNCAGGPTPWGTWLSCEEFDGGRVWECDPTGRRSAVVHPALGVFTHEAVGVDLARGHAYLTEDLPDGGWYRYVAPGPVRDGRLDLDRGVLEVARVVGSRVEWLRVPDPLARDVPTRAQVPRYSPFNGGEGLWCADDLVHFTTKGDGRVWRYDCASQRLAVIYDSRRAVDPVLTGVDNCTIAPNGALVVAEDAGDMQLVAVHADGTLDAIVQVVGHTRSEMTGPAFDPPGTRLYFSSQRGAGRDGTTGVTYEVTGPFARL